MADPSIDDIQALSDQIMPVIKPLLAGQHPAIQGGALADVVATWLAGHCYLGKVDETRALREHLLTEFIITVQHLLPICAEQLGTPHDPLSLPTADVDPYRRH